ncbi:hypothetical protein OCK74_13130 [Chitinophagaceae bacterium LB-8]|uniref:Outer membrane protein beta-barrel domain-containing protein n=1 Tax=Paraflavisolibacter caeni TaxID=2982496 RepID=A0A9X2XW64_9BACT|nr:hypothetical protein [Paraflavisolibacter caeni]MCU7550060.1 hypothetical protein [Paraflavisolibacter caeni]
MKKNITLSCLFLLLSFISFSQTSKWFVTVGSGYSFGGPANGIKNQMRKSGWNDMDEDMVLGFNWSTNYPRKNPGLPLMLTAGKKLKEYKSIYFTAGLADNATVKGFKKEGEAYLLILGGSYGRYISVDYKIWQIAGGYQYAFPNARIKLGFGPSLLLLNSKATNADSSINKQNSLVPALVGNARLPLGREKRLFGVEFFIQTTLAPPAKVEDFTKVGSSDKVSLGMSNLTLGLALALRRK